MPITPAEHDTFYFITKLTRNLSPGHSVYVAREKDVNDMPLSYHAGVAKCKGEVMKYVLMDSGTADERINVLESLLGDLEDYAYDNFEQIEAEQRAKDADSDAKVSSSEEEDEAGKRKGKTLSGGGTDKKPRLDIEGKHGEQDDDFPKSSEESSPPLRVKAREKPEDRELKEEIGDGKEQVKNKNSESNELAKSSVEVS
ncbi:hypothetical protein J4E91_003101 [Alternaria rosae]|nr:hypothetical protein J4E91_003101 [Alternaria rosae]